MRIYTGRGDAGRTDLGDRSRVSKTSPRIEAYGTVDELNALVGTIRPTGHSDVDEYLREIQNHLHVLQADLAAPPGREDEGGSDDGGEGPEYTPPRVDQAHVDTLEDWIDDCDAELDDLDSFLLPAGGEAGSGLHHARTVCRRAERRTVALAAEEAVGEAALAYLNRLSDALFTFARLVNDREGVGEEHPEY